MMMVIIVPIIIIIIIVGMSIPNTQSRPKTQGGTTARKPEPTPCHRRGGGKPPQADPPPDHTTPQGGGKQPTTPQGGGNHWGGRGGGAAEPGSYIYIYICTSSLERSWKGMLFACPGPLISPTSFWAQRRPSALPQACRPCWSGGRDCFGGWRGGFRCVAFETLQPQA